MSAPSPSAESIAETPFGNQSGTLEIPPIVRTRLMVIVPFVARLPHACVKCGAQGRLIYEQRVLPSVTRSLAQERFPTAFLGYYLCRRHKRIASILRWIGASFLLAAPILFVTDLSALVGRRGGGPVVAGTLLLGLMLTAWGGPVRVWKIEGQRAWIWGPRRSFRRRFELASRADRWGFFRLPVWMRKKP